jgi:hypothetical protein
LECRPQTSLSKERDEHRLESSQKGHVLRELQDQIRAASGKVEQLNGIRKAVELAFGFTAKLELVDLLWSLVFDREDRILVAKTGYGKSAVPQLLPLLTRSSIVIVLLLLNALGAEQLADIQRLPLAKTNLGLGCPQKIITRLHYEESGLVSSPMSWCHRKSLVA